MLVSLASSFAAATTVSSQQGCNVALRFLLLLLRKRNLVQELLVTLNIPCFKRAVSLLRGVDQRGLLSIRLIKSASYK
jgi:hypothetical protein